MPSLTELGQKKLKKQLYQSYKNNSGVFFQGKKTLTVFMRWQATVHVLTFWTCKLLTN